MPTDSEKEEDLIQAPQAICIGCKKEPKDLMEYAPEFTGTQMSPDDYVWAEEGTLNLNNGHFLCTACYIKAGQPSSKHGWRAP